MHLQPWLHEFEIAVDGPSTVLSTHDGQLGSPGTGWFVDDRRVLAVLDVSVDAESCTAVACDSVGNRSQFWAVARHLGDPTPDPTVEVHRVRTLSSHAMTEEIRIASRASEPVTATLSVLLGGDGADLGQVKAGARDVLELLRTLDADLDGDDDVDGDGGGGGPAATWSDERHRTSVSTTPVAGQVRHTPDGVLLSWPVHVLPGASAAVRIVLEARRRTPTAFDAGAGSHLADWTDLPVGDDPQWQRLVRTNLTDLQHLLLTDPQAPEDVFAAAGSPWYLTLFGRDSLWAARFMLPFSNALPLGTLRVLARRQATEDDPALAAEAGKIPHEVRRTTFAGGDLALPPVYYGTVDATPLWVVVLHDAWRWGLDPARVRELLPTLHAALGWMERTCAESPDGFLRYLDTTGTGLSNQGWKDSGDSMRRADGTLAPAPIALLEAQGYAVEAALGGAALLEAVGEEGAERWRAWATALARRVRERFWVGAGAEAYLAMALDAHGEPVDGVGSNMGHALGTGLLTQEETSRVVERLMRPDLLREFGIATLSADNPAYNPAGYHSGSVWTHDTAIILHGMWRTGHTEGAERVTAALLRLASAVHHRFPELTAGDPVGSRPVPYPASCRPQAWSAASAAVMLTARLGLRPPS